MRYKLAKIKTSHHAMGKLSLEIIKFFFHRIIPSHEGQMQSFSASAPGILKHPLIRGADFLIFLSVSSFCDSSPLARGRLDRQANPSGAARFIPSCEGQTIPYGTYKGKKTIHPLLRGADRFRKIDFKKINDSSPLARGRHSVFMRLSAALSTSLCNLHKCPFQLQLVTHHFLYL